ncbi:MAG: response regulator transcription factor [Thermomicrobiales bacterium]
MALKLLIAEDARELAELVAFGLRMNWPDCAVTIVADGREALQRFTEEAPDLVILDVAIPPPNGFEVCQRIRQASRVPVMMMTGHTDVVDKVRAFDLGADDYVTKPFDQLEFMARLRALMRRSSTAAPAADFAAGDLTIDFTTHEVRLCGEVAPLTATEYQLLAELVRHAGTVLPNQILLERVWGPQYVNDIHYVKVFIRRLRRKLGDDAEHPRYIQTKWGVGYRFLLPGNPLP